MYIHDVLAFKQKQKQKQLKSKQIQFFNIHFAFEILYDTKQNITLSDRNRAHSWAIYPPVTNISPIKGDDMFFISNFEPNKGWRLDIASPDIRPVNFKLQQAIQILIAATFFYYWYK